MGVSYPSLHVFPWPSKVSGDTDGKMTPQPATQCKCAQRVLRGKKEGEKDCRNLTMKMLEELCVSTFSMASYLLQYFLALFHYYLNYLYCIIMSWLNSIAASLARLLRKIRCRMLPLTLFYSDRGVIKMMWQLEEVLSLLTSLIRLISTSSSLFTHSCTPLNLAMNDAD